MAVTIRLSRAGRIHAPFYHIGVYDKRTRRDGRPIEALGFYDPESTKEPVRVKEDRVRHWLAEGADASATVTALLKRAGIAIAADAAKTRLEKKAKTEGRKKAAPAAAPVAGEKKAPAKKAKKAKVRTANSKKAAERKNKTNA